MCQKARIQNGSAPHDIFLPWFHRHGEAAIPNIFRTTFDQVESSPAPVESHVDLGQLLLNALQQLKSERGIGTAAGDATQSNLEASWNLGHGCGHRHRQFLSA